MAEERNQLHIEVRGKIATLTSRNFQLVGGNSDYEVVFDFDEEWADCPTKTAIFVYGKAEPIYKVFDGNICNGVAINDATMCLIGVVAGNVKTTTPACVECVYRSILDEANGVPQPPTEDVYNQIMHLLNQYINASKGAPKGGKTGQVLKKNSDEDYDYSWHNDEVRDLTMYYTKEEADDRFIDNSELKTAMDKLNIRGDEDIIVSNEKDVDIEYTVTSEENEWGEIYSFQVTSALPIVPGTFNFDGLNMTFTDNGDGTLSNSSIDEGLGTIDYESGMVHPFPYCLGVQGAYKIDGATFLSLATPLKSILGQINKLNSDISGIEDDLALLNDGGIE